MPPKDSDIAIVGMAARLPGAGNLGDFWDNLRAGVESISRFSDAKAAAGGVAPELLRNPAYVRAEGLSNKANSNMPPKDSDIAIAGMAARLPGAGNLDDFWDNLRAGVESISRFSDAEAAASGVAPELLRNPGYVRAGGVLEQGQQ